MNFIPELKYILWLIPLIVIPFLIHYFQKWKKKKVYFSTIFLFTKELKKANKAIKVKNTILTIFRTLLILLAVLLIAKPLSNQEYDVWEVEKETKRISLILLDNSKSMDYFFSNTNLFKQAINQIKLLIKGFPAKNPVLFVELASELTLPFKINENPEQVLKRLRFVRVSDIKFTYDKKIRLIKEKLKKSKIKIKDIFIFSDFQKKQRISKGNRESEWNKIELDDNIPLYLIKLGEDEKQNIAIEKVKVDDAIHYSFIGAEINVDVKNYSNVIQKNYLNITLDEELKEKREITLNPGELKTIKFNGVKVLKNKWIEGKAFIDYDRYKPDNSAYFNVFFKKNLNVLILGRKANPVISYALKKSISSKTPTERPDIKFYSKLTEEIEFYDLIICNRVGQLQYNELLTLYKSINKNIPILFIFNQSDTVYSIRKAFRKLAILNDLNIKKKIALKQNQYLTISGLINQEHPIRKAFPKRLNINFKSVFQLDYQKNIYQPLLSIGNYPILLEPFVPHHNIFIFTAGVNIENSNILYRQTFPLLINWIYQRGIKKQLLLTNKIITKNNYLAESNLESFSLTELKVMFNNSRLTVLTDINQWLKRFIMKPDKTIVQINGYLETIFYIILLCLFFLELIFSYSSEIKLKLPFLKKYQSF